MKGTLQRLQFWTSLTACLFVASLKFTALAWFTALASSCEVKMTNVFLSLLLSSSSSSPCFLFFLLVGSVCLATKKAERKFYWQERGEKKLCFRISSLKQKAEEVWQFLLTHTYLDTKKLHWFFSMVHSFCTQTHHKNSISPFHSISCWRISILMLSFFHPRKEDQKPKISQTLEKQILHVNSTALA